MQTGGNWRIVKEESEGNLSRGNGGRKMRGKEDKEETEERNKGKKKRKRGKTK